MQIPAVLLIGFAALIAAQSSSTIVYPTTAGPSATSLPSASGYSYVGCYNETTNIAGTGGVRAITGGKVNISQTLTISSCLAYCANSKDDNGVKMQFAGIEYGEECYCGPYLSVLSLPINASRCNYACNGNASEVCGGSLALSLYNLTSDSKTGMAWSLLPSSGAMYGSLIAMGFLLVAVL